MKIKILICTMFFLTLNACLASTKMASYKNPDFENKKINTLLIFANEQDLLKAQQVESVFFNNFKRAGISAYKRIDLFSPAKSYTDSEIQKIIKNNHVEAVLVVSLTDEYKDHLTMPTTYNSTTNFYGNSAKTTGTTSGGGTVSMLRQQYTINLVDVKSKTGMWTTSSFTAGNGWARRKTLLNSLSVKVARELKSQGVVNKTIVK